ncbi:MAG: hypothetical protein NT177_07000 [Chloroflexi bacterium]|nr:hypothetical protein [Chloroflexota bacterium]
METDNAGLKGDSGGMNKDYIVAGWIIQIIGWIILIGYGVGIWGPFSKAYESGGMDAAFLSLVHTEASGTGGSSTYLSSFVSNFFIAAIIFTICQFIGSWLKGKGK